MKISSFFKNQRDFRKRKAIIINKKKFFTYDQVFKQSKIFDLNLLIFIPIKYAGKTPASERTENLPPIKFLCST